MSVGFHDREAVGTKRRAAADAGNSHMGFQAEAKGSRQWHVASLERGLRGVVGASLKPGSMSQPSIRAALKNAPRHFSGCLSLAETRLGGAPCRLFEWG